jgi:hypothetical protein
MSKKQQRKCVSRSATLTIPELEQSKQAVLNTLASAHSQRTYKYAIERFIAWYCYEPQLAFNRPRHESERVRLDSRRLAIRTAKLGPKADFRSRALGGIAHRWNPVNGENEGALREH